MLRVLPFVLALAACTAEPPSEPIPMPGPGPEPDAGLIFVRPYRAEGDQCMLVGESAATAQYLDDSADLVACPVDYEGTGVFIAETGAAELGFIGAWRLYSVARG